MGTSSTLSNASGPLWGDDLREMAVVKLELNDRVQIALLAHDAGEA